MSGIIAFTITIILNFVSLYLASCIVKIISKAFHIAKFWELVAKTVALNKMSSVEFLEAWKTIPCNYPFSFLRWNFIVSISEPKWEVWLQNFVNAHMNDEAEEQS
jgi:hypothetical protein